MHAHAFHPSADTRQGYPGAPPPAPPSTVPQPPRPAVPSSAAPAARPSAYQASSFTASASHIATFAPSVAPSYSAPSPAPAPAAPPSPYYSAHAQAQPGSYSGHPSVVTGHARSASVPFDVPDRSQPTPVAPPRHRHSPPRDNAASYAMPDSAGRYPVANEMGQLPSSSSRQIDPKLASAFPVNEDSPGRSSQRQHTRKPSTGSLRPQTRDEQRAAASSQQYAYPYAADSRPRTTKTSSPGQPTTSVPQSAAPPRSAAAHYVPSPRAAPPPVPSASYAYDSSRSHAPVSQPPTYPDTIVYPPSASRVDAAHTTTSHPTVATPSYNASTRAAPGNLSRYQAHPTPQPQSHLADTSLNARSASQDTGSTTLVGHTPPQYASAVPAAASSAVQDPSGYSPGSRYPTAVPALAPSASSARHYNSRYHSDTTPQPSPPSAQQSVTATKTPTQPASIAVPKPARSYSASQTPADARRGPAPIHIPARQFSSPGEDDELNTPSSLDPAPREFYANALHPVTTTQSLPEGKKKAGFLGLFSRSRSGGKESILQPGVRPPTSAGVGAGGKASASKTSLAFGSDGETKASARRKAPAPAPPPSSAPHAHTHAPHGTHSATMSRKEAAMFRLLSKHRMRTMSGASAEAVDGTNAGVSFALAFVCLRGADGAHPQASTVRASPASSLRSSVAPAVPPFRDPVQATHDWRNRAEADEGVRGSSRRRRPGVTFDVYEDQPQAEDHRVPYVHRRRQPIPQQLVEQP
jgi:hypothetical protein